ncbi:MAG: hypothetical protein JKX69_05480 [Rhodobacteraceae bacterium]|nr:hypothetical protein [Paracoccaceae bacterium]
MLLRTPAPPTRSHQKWGDIMFAAAAAQSGIIVRRNIRDVDRDGGRERLLREVRRRGYHMVECGGQFIIICNASKITVHA